MNAERSFSLTIATVLKTETYLKFEISLLYIKLKNAKHKEEVKKIKFLIKQSPRYHSQH